MQIRVNAVNPTAVNIGMGPRVWSDLGLYDEHKARIPLQKFAGHILLYITAKCVDAIGPNHLTWHIVNSAVH